MNTYRLDADARLDVDSIYDYIAKQNQAAADRLIDLFWAKFEFLARHPLAGEHRPELSDDLRSFTAGRYVILYRPVAGGVEIARIIHSARDLEGALSEDPP
jgi:toxin ParE1/3/4